MRVRASIAATYEPGESGNRQGYPTRPHRRNTRAAIAATRHAGRSHRKSPLHLFRRDRCRAGPLWRPLRPSWAAV